MSKQMTRKDFCGTLFGGTVLLLIQGCGGGGSDYGGSAAAGSAGAAATPGTAAATPPAGCSDTIADNHGHVLVIAAADLDSAYDMVYNIQGTASHNHTVTLTVADLHSLKTAVTVSTTSSLTLSHQHGISAMCV